LYIFITFNNFGKQYFFNPFKTKTMKTKLLTFGILISVLSLSLSAQEIETRCGTASPTEEEFDAMPHLGNNKALIAVLKRHGLHLPEDYFDKLDNRGLYNGRGLSLDEVRNPNANPPGRKKNGQDNLKDGSTQEKSSVSNFSPTTYLPVKFWVYINNAGDSAFTKAEVNEMLFGMQEIFRNSGIPIEFYMKCDPVWIQSETYYHVNHSTYGTMWSTNKDNNAINVHLVRSATGSGGGSVSGLAERPGISQYVARLGSDPITERITTFSHEMGHNLGLMHTHNGRCSSDNNYACSDCRQEPVDRYMTQNCFTGFSQRKCEVNGDALCDTPADPLLSSVSVNNNCSINRPGLPTQTDNWGDTWYPSTRNVMSYSERICRLEFTFGQIGVMMNTLEDRDDLFSFQSTGPTQLISGPSNLCINQSYNFSVPSQSGTDYYHWQVPNGWTVSGQGNPSVSITVNSNFNASDIYVTAACGSPIAKKIVNVNIQSLSISGSDEIPNDGYCRVYSANQLNGVTTYNWSISSNNPSAISICSGQGSRHVYIAAAWNAEPFVLNVSANTCGGVANGHKQIQIGQGDHPIPRQGENPLFANIKITQLNTFELWEEIECLQSKDEFNSIIKNLPKGYYLIRYQEKGKSKSQKIIKP